MPIAHEVSHSQTSCQVVKPWLVVQFGLQNRRSPQGLVRRPLVGFHRKVVDILRVLPLLLHEGSRRKGSDAPPVRFAPPYRRRSQVGYKGRGCGSRGSHVAPSMRTATTRELRGCPRTRQVCVGEKSRRWERRGGGENTFRYGGCLRIQKSHFFSARKLEASCQFGRTAIVRQTSRAQVTRGSTSHSARYKNWEAHRSKTVDHTSHAKPPVTLNRHKNGMSPQNCTGRTLVNRPVSVGIATLFSTSKKRGLS